MSAAEPNEWPSFSDVLDVSEDTHNTWLQSVAAIATSSPTNATVAIDSAASVRWPSVESMATSTVPTTDATVSDDADPNRDLVATVPLQEFDHVQEAHDVQDRLLNSEFVLPPPLEPLNLDLSSLDRLIPDSRNSTIPKVDPTALSALEPLDDVPFEMTMIGAVSEELAAPQKLGVRYSWPELQMASRLEEADAVEHQQQFLREQSTTPRNSIEDAIIVADVADTTSPFAQPPVGTSDWVAWGEDPVAEGKQPGATVTPFTDTDGYKSIASKTATEIEDHLGELLLQEDDFGAEASSVVFDQEVADEHYNNGNSRSLNDALGAELTNLGGLEPDPSNLSVVEMPSRVVDTDLALTELAIGDELPDAEVLQLYPEETQDSDNIVGLDEAVDTPSLSWTGVQALETQEDPWAYMRPDEHEDVKKKGLWSKLRGDSKRTRSEDIANLAPPSGHESPTCPNCAADGQVDLHDPVGQRLHSSCGSCEHVWTDSYGQ